MNKPAYPKNAGDWIMEIVALAALLVNLFPLFVYSDLPERIPSHFDLAGKIDGWSERSTILTLVGWSSMLYIGLSLIQRYAHKLKYDARIKPEKLPEAYRMNVRLFRCTKAFALVVFAVITIQTYAKAVWNTNLDLVAWLYPATFIAFVWLFVYLIRQSARLTKDR